MEELKNAHAPALPALPKLRRTPLLTDALAFAVLLGGGWGALRLADAIFHLLGAA